MWKKCETIKYKWSDKLWFKSFLLQTYLEPWSPDNVTLKIKPQNTYLFIPSLSPQARPTTSPEDKIQKVFKASPNYTWNHTLNSCLLSVLSLKHFLMCVGEPVLCKIGKHYIILDSIGWSKNSLLSPPP